MPPTQSSQPDPKCSSMRTISAGLAGAAGGGGGAAVSAPVPGAIGEPAIAATTMPSTATLGQPTGSLGTKAENATCRTGRVLEGSRTMVKARAPLRLANPADGGSTTTPLERGSESRHVTSVLRLVGSAPVAGSGRRGVRLPGQPSCVGGVRSATAGKRVRNFGISISRLRFVALKAGLP